MEVEFALRICLMCHARALHEFTLCTWPTAISLGGSVSCAYGSPWGAQSATPQAVEQVKYGASTIAVEPQQFEFVSCAQVKIPPLRSIHT